MQTYDIIMIVVLAAATMFGAWKGLAWQIASLASIVASYFVACEFREQVAQMISAEPPWNMFLAMFILYVGTYFVIWLMFRFVSEFIDRVKLKEFDRHAGALLGFAKGVILCVLVTLFAVGLLEDYRQDIVESTSGKYIAMLLDKAHSIMPEEVHDVLHPVHERLDSAVTENGQSPLPNTLPPGTQISPDSYSLDDVYLHPGYAPANGSTGAGISPQDSAPRPVNAPQFNPTNYRSQSQSAPPLQQPNSGYVPPAYYPPTAPATNPSPAPAYAPPASPAGAPSGYQF